MNHPSIPTNRKRIVSVFPRSSLFTRNKWQNNSMNHWWNKLCTTSTWKMVNHLFSTNQKVIFQSHNLISHSSRNRLAIPLHLTHNLHFFFIRFFNFFLDFSHQTPITTTVFSEFAFFLKKFVFDFVGFILNITLNGTYIFFFYFFLLPNFFFSPIPILYDNWILWLNIVLIVNNPPCLFFSLIYIWTNKKTNPKKNCIILVIFCVLTTQLILYISGVRMCILYNIV